MKTLHLLTLEMIFLSTLAGCANKPPEQECREGLDEEFEVFHANGNRMHNHRSPYFVAYLFEAEVNEAVGDYESCVEYLAAARLHGHPRATSKYGRSSASSNGQNETGRAPGSTRAANPRGGGGARGGGGGGGGGGGPN